MKRSHEKEFGRSSGWIFLDSANKLFLSARARVCGDQKNPKSLIKFDKNKIFFDKSNKGLKMVTNKIKNKKFISKKILMNVYSKKAQN